MTEVFRDGLDPSRVSFQLPGVDAAEAPVLKRQLSRTQMLAFFQKQPACLGTFRSLASPARSAPLPGSGTTGRAWIPTGPATGRAEIVTLPSS